MLKKLVKYGNSNALVLDKALLELLNITEGSVVKIKTDGTSLIITPQGANTGEVISPTVTTEEAVKKAISTLVEQAPAHQPAQYDVVQLTAQFGKVHAKYSHILQLAAQLNENPEYINQSVLLAEKYQATQNSPEYIKEYTSLITSYIPEYANYQAELKAVAQSAQ